MSEKYRYFLENSQSIQQKVGSGNFVVFYGGVKGSIVLACVNPCYPKEVFKVAVKPYSKIIRTPLLGSGVKFGHTPYFNHNAMRVYLRDMSPLDQNSLRMVSGEVLEYYRLLVDMCVREYEQIQTAILSARGVY